MKVLLTGGSGMLGQAVQTAFAGHVVLLAPPRTQLDITKPAHIQQWLAQEHPDWVVHLAALTHVDQCQHQPHLAFQVNAYATEQLVIACQHFQIPLLFLSSIAVFDGEKENPYHEADTPRPINVYGQSKWQAEQAVATLPHHLIVRTGWLFGGQTSDKKFVRRIWQLAQERPLLSVVNDKIGSPTYVHDLARGLLHLLQEGRRGTVHLVNVGRPVSRYQLAQHILQATNLPTPIQPVPSSYFPHLAPRPAMEAATSHHVHHWLPAWTQSLEDYLHTFVQ